MLLPYEEFKYIYPPRAETKISPEALEFFENRRWLAQFKLNGTNSQNFVTPDKKVVAMNRYAEFHKAWQHNENTSKSFKNILGDGWHVVNSELMHNKTPHIKNINFIHDILVYNGYYLFGTKYIERYNLLRNLFTVKDETESHYVIDDYTWLAKNHYKGFREIYESLTNEEHEGLVLKNPEGRWTAGGKIDWAAKARKTHKNYSF